jgi:Hg(II)-responsive transcriptional regulator
MNLTIGQIAAATSLNPQTVRYYERRGLIEPTNRTRAGYRQYDAQSVNRLRFIKRAQTLGFSLAEIQELLALRVRHGAACAAVERATLQKVRLVDAKLRELQSLKRTLRSLATSCRKRKRTSECPILEALDDDYATRSARS